MLPTKVRLGKSSRAIVIVILIFVTTFFFRNILNGKKYVIIHWEPVTNNVSCHYSSAGDALPGAEGAGYAPAPRSLFFHETSCRGGLSSRQACAVESAARAHPRRQVHVLFSAPVTEYILKNSVLAQLQELENVHFSRVHIEDYSLGIFPRDLLEELKSSNYSVSHTSDVLRIVTLKKWGGVYLDTDLVVLKSLDNLPPNWVAKQADHEVAPGILALANDVTGKNISSALVSKMLEIFDPFSHSMNGPGVITYMLQEVCPKSVILAGEHCNGFYIFGPKLFYPVTYACAEHYFVSRDPDVHCTDNTAQPYTHHMWNGLTWRLDVHKDSHYADLARNFCPSVYEMYGLEFGV